ncbi:hypothetical protein GE09DRAFT_1176797 [Coniochaeta sp. 2T2.1]|nr:hypothetical protein GE09DRAFT_1176797 [Coniochaeta sp. 2T2.1]
MEANGLDKFLPKSIAAKRRRKKRGSIAETTSSADEAGPGSGGAAADGGEGGTGSSANTSLVSYESDPELPDRPTIPSTHHSQIGYLTTNSPIVQAAVHLETEPSHTSDTPSSARSSTFPVNSTRTYSPGSTAALATSKTGLTAPTSQAQRSPSPVGRFRDVFKNKSSSGTGSPSPERAPLADALRPKSSSNAPEADLEPVRVPEPTKAAASSSERFRRLSQGAKVDTSRPPQTPPSSENKTPVIVNTPPTPTDPQYPSFHDSPVKNSAATTPLPANASPPQKGNMISQRRRAGSATLGPSKLSNIVQAPLTPTLENPASPGNAVSGFFSSMMSTVQSTANTLSNSIGTANLGQGASRNRLPLQEEGQNESQGATDSVEVESGTGATSEHSMDAKEPAVKTLGKGDLSLSHLGIEEPKSAAGTPLTAKFPDLQNESMRGRSESAPVDNGASDAVDRAQDRNRPQSLYEPVGNGMGEHTPPQGSVYEDSSGIKRSGSIRSAIAGRRKRGSSVATGATGNTIAAAIAAANSSLTRPQTDSNAPKLTGFAVASKKRNRDFHALFKSVPDDDYLIEDYSCALQREILAHGRLYVSEGHLCFSSNIFGWVTTLVMGFDEIVAVEKRSTALVFKNGLEISTLHAKHIFASFTGRDATYDLIVKIWKLGHPSLKSSLNGVRIDETGGDRTEKVDIDASSIGGSATISGSGSDSDDDGDDDIYDEDEDNDDTAEITQATEPTSLDAPHDKIVARKSSGAPLANMPAGKEEGTAGTPSQDFPGPAAHAPTDCGDAATHYDIIIGDDVIPAPLGKVYNLMFGPACAAWMGKWITGDQKCTELTGLLEDKKGLVEDNKTRGYTYIKPLNSSIGPKQTKCIVTEQLDNLDLEKSVNISCSTQNPDVPSGNIFTVKTKYCLSWAENNATRVQANCTIEWTGKSWLKGPIEKGARDGQTQYCKDLFASLKTAVASRARSGTIGGGAGKTGRKKGRKGRTVPSTATSDGEGVRKTVAKPDWGFFDPVRPFLSPFVDIVKPIMTGNVVYGLLVGLLVATWFGFGSNASSGRYGRDLGYIANADRHAAYEEMWRREESELWEWLEERVGLERLNGAPPVGGAVPPPKKAAFEEKMRQDKMSEREIKEAIRVTEEKLKILKSVVDKEAEEKA